MRRHRFYLKSFVPSDTVVRDADLVHQVFRVLKLHVGEEIVVWNGDGIEYVFLLDAIESKKITGHVVRSESNTNEPTRQVTLYCAVLKRENFELVAQKATEVGIHVLVPLCTDRTVKTAVNTERLKKIMQEAAEQSGRGRIPQLRGQSTLYDALRDIPGSEQRIFFDTTEANHTPHTSMPHGGVHLFIGPEGGWSDEERVAAKAAGCTFASLGPLTLRAETAAIVAAYITINLP